MTSVVHFIQSVSGLVKIGWPGDIGRRLTNLSVASGEPLTLLAYTPGGGALEAHLHEVFAEHRVRGEWFHPVPEIMRMAEQARSGGSSIFPAGFAPEAKVPGRGKIKFEPAIEIASRLARKLISDPAAPRQQQMDEVARKAGVTSWRAYDLVRMESLCLVPADEIRALQLAVRKQGNLADLRDELKGLVAEAEAVAARIEEVLGDECPADRSRRLAAGD